MSIAFDHSGNVLTTGTIYNGTADFGGGPITSGYQQIGYAVKLAGATGAHMWSKRLGNPDVPGNFHQATARGIAVDGNDNVTVTGFFDGSIDFGGGSLTAAGNNAAYSDIFVAQYTKDGVHRWSKRFGGNSMDVGNGVTTDRATNDVIASGSFGGSGDFGAGTLTSAGADDAYLVRMRS